MTYITTRPTTQTGILNIPKHLVFEWELEKHKKEFEAMKPFEQSDQSIFLANKKQIIEKIAAYKDSAFVSHVTLLNPTNLTKTEGSAAERFVSIDTTIQNSDLFPLQIPDLLKLVKHDLLVQTAMPVLNTHDLFQFDSSIYALLFYSNGSAPLYHFKKVEEVLATINTHLIGSKNKTPLNDEHRDGLVL